MSLYFDGVLVMLRTGISIALVLSASTLLAQYKTDAYGIFVDFASPSNRDKWAGYQERIQPSRTIEGAVINPDYADTLTVLAGPESAIAGDEIMHIAVVGQDRHGNMVPDATDVTIDVGGSGLHDTSTIDGISDYAFRAPTRVGRYNISAFTDTRQSKRIEYRVVPNWQSARIDIQSGLSDLSSEEVFELETSVLTDQFGNALGDGVSVQFQLTDANNHNAQTVGVTVRGVAEGGFITRDINRDIAAQAFLGAVPSNEISFEIAPIDMLKQPEILATRRDQLNAIELTIGPFLTDENYLLHDGTQINVMASNGDRVAQSSGYLLDGYATVTVLMEPDTVPLKIDVTSNFGSFTTSVTEFDEQQTGAVQ